MLSINSKNNTLFQAGPRILSKNSRQAKESGHTVLYTPHRDLAQKTKRGSTLRTPVQPPIFLGYRQDPLFRDARPKTQGRGRPGRRHV